MSSSNQQITSTRNPPRQPLRKGKVLMSSIIPTPSLVLIAAAPRSGKSYLIRYMISSLCEGGKFEYGAVFSTTGKFNGDYDYIPPQYVHSEYTDEKLDRIMEMQRRQPKESRKPMFIVFDDMTNQVKMDSRVFCKLIQAYRHYNCTVIFATHLIPKVSTLFRECCTIAIIFRMRTKRSYDALHENFFGDIDRNEIEEFIKNYTSQPYQYLMVSNATQDPNERYSSGKAPPNYPVRMIRY